MSRSHRDQKGQRIAGEILGKGSAAVIDGRLIARSGGHEVGSPAGKRYEKRLVSRLRRIDGKRALRVDADLAG